MKRLLVLFLICVLPLQVIAGMGSLRTAKMSQVQQMQQMQHVDSDREQLAQDTSEQRRQSQQQGPQDDGSSVADLTNVDGEDFSHHASIGDEPLLAMAVMFAAESSRLAPALRSDPAIQPPFLPPAGRPPRV